MNLIYSAIDAVLPFEWLSPVFMKNAFLAILIACPLFGILGTSVVVPSAFVIVSITAT